MRLLIVDDIDANLVSLEYLLYEYMDDVEVIKANSAEVAMKKVLDGGIDLILLDVQMPKIDGFEFAKYLKSNRVTKNIPIIFLTAAFTKDEFKRKGFELGAIDYLTKPIDDLQLINKLKLYLEIIEKNRLLQRVIDLNRSMILVTKENKIVMANKELLSFFNVNRIEDFRDGVSGFVDKVRNFKIGDSTNECKSKLFYNWIKGIEGSTKIVNFLVDKNRFFHVELSEDSDIVIYTFTDITRLHKENQLMSKRAKYDSLTKVLNRESFNDLLFEEISRAICEDIKFSILLFDIDYFKKINDTYGHLVGDEVLIKFSKIIDERVKDTGYFARWGGEEFILLLKNSSIEMAKNVAEELRELIQNSDFGSVKVTVSIGVSEYEGGDSIDTIIKRCDEALYEAKRNGRNRVESLLHLNI